MYLQPNTPPTVPPPAIGSPQGVRRGAPHVVSPRGPSPRRCSSREGMTSQPPSSVVARPKPLQEKFPPPPAAAPADIAGTSPVHGGRILITSKKQHNKMNSKEHQGQTGAQLGLAQKGGPP